jgi:hypothetical protein
MEFDNTTALRDALEGMETPQLDRMLLEELRKEEEKPSKAPTKKSDN